MASSNGNDITLKMGIDTTDARNAVTTFSAYADKGFKSSNTRMQGMANSLTRVVQNLQKCVTQMEKMKTTYVPTKDYSEAVKTIDSLEKKIRSADSEMKKLWKNRPETAEYAQARATFEAINAKVKELQATLKQSYGKNALTEEFRAVSAEVDKAQAKLSKLNAQKLIMESGGTNSGKAYDTLKNKVGEAETALNNAKTAQQQLINQGKQYKDQTGYNKVVSDLKTIQSLMQQYTTYLEQLRSSGKQFDTTAYDEAKAKLDVLKQAYEEAKAKKDALERTGSDRDTIGNVNPEALKTVQTRMGDIVRQGNLITNNMDKISIKTVNWRSAISKISSLWSNLNNKIKNVVTGHNNASKSLSGFSKNHTSSFKSMITMVLKYVFGIRSIFLLYKKIRTTISTGLTEMSKQFSDVADDVYELKNSWSGFKASLVSAFQPIFSYVVPALTTLINYLTSAMNALANFFAMLTGQSYYYKAKKGNESVAKSIGSTGSAAEEANEELAEYDDLIVIDQNSDSGSGGGGGSSSDSDAWNWEKVETEAVSLDERLTNVWNKFKDSWEKNGQTTVDKAKNAIESIKTLVSTVANTIYEVFMSDTGTAWLDSSYNLLNSFLDLIASIASAWTKAWNDNNTGYNLVNSVFTLLTTINNTLSTIMTTWAKVFNSETGYKTLESFLTLAKNIVDTVNSIATAFTNAWKKDETGYKNVESFFNLFKDISDLLSTITESFKKAWESDGTGENTIKNILDSITNINDTLGNIATNFKTAWDNAGTGNEIMETLLGMFESLSSFTSGITDSTKSWSENLDLTSLLESVSGVLSSVSGLFDSILTTISDIYNNFVLPIAKKATESYIPTLLDSISSGLDSIKSLLDGLPTADISTALSEIVDLIATIGFENLKNNMSSISELCASLGTYVSTLYTSAKDLWSAVSPLIGIETGSWEDFKTVLIAVNTATTPLSTALDLLNANIQLNINAVTTIKEKLDELKSWIDTNKDTITQLGSSLSGGIVGGIAGYDWIKNITDSMFSPLVNAIKTVFGIASPAKKMYTYGEYILDGIIQGIKNAFDNIKDTVKSLYDKFVSNVKDKFKDFKISDFLTGLGDVAVNITTTFKNGITKLADFTGLNTTLNTISTKYKDMKAKLKTTMEGVASKIGDLDELKTKFTNLTDSWKDKASKLKAEVGGQLSKVTDIDTWKTKFTNLTTAWQDDSATMKAKVGEQISNINELSTNSDSWKTKFTNLFTAWKDKSATYSTKTGGQINSINELSTTSGTSWKDKFLGLFNQWKSPDTAEFKATEDSQAPKDSIDKGNYNYSKTNWKNQQATFSATDGAGTIVDSIDKGTYKKAKDNWQNQKATFSATESMQDVTNAVASDGEFTKAKNAWTSPPTATFKAVPDTSDVTYSRTTNDSSSSNNLAYEASKWSETKAEATFTGKTDLKDVKYSFSNPGGEFYKFWDEWRNTTTSATFTASFSYSQSEFNNFVTNLRKQMKEQLQMTFSVNMSGGQAKFTANALGGAFYNGSWHDIPQYASGGKPNHGSLFLAGEAGPEIVGHLNGRTEVLNKSQIASTLHSAFVTAMNQFGNILVSALDRNFALMYSLTNAVTDKLLSMNIPDIVTGSILPMTEAFTNATLKTDTSVLEQKLDMIISALTDNSDSNIPTVMLQLEGRQIAQAVWSESEKRYKQTGVRPAY